jgi:hypothetical protein
MGDLYVVDVRSSAVKAFAADLAAHTGRDAA